jgi:hypothetical protein
VSCSSFDWKAYALGELDANGRHEAEAHAATCLACRDELAGLRLTLDALSTMREEEIPRRIAFVSDKVFEPRWWQSFLRPSFAAGCVIAAAILVHAFVRPPAPTPVDTAEIEAKIEAAVSQRIDAAIAKAVSATEDRQTQRTRQMLADNEKRYTDQRRADFATIAASNEMLSKQLDQVYAANTGLGVGQ